MLRAVDPQPSFPALELEVLERWRQRDVFAESLRRREGAEQWVFYEGPPTANGLPGSHHVLARVFKDIYPRYKTMRGYRVERKGGWDCHGLAVEIAVEQQLGFTNKMQIEEYGIAEFNGRCRDSVFEFLEDWNALTERIGFWLDLDDAYRTLDASYIESVWWALEQIHAKGKLYESNRVVPYCPRCGTALSSHEVSQGYRDVIDTSAYVKLWLLGHEEALVVWTTTPWTLPANLAAAVGPQLTYARVAVGGETLIVAAPLVERVFGEGAQVIGTLEGWELVGRHYESPIFALAGRPAGSGEAPVIGADFVSTEDGTGIVHIAPAFGEDDFRVGVAEGLFDPTNPHTLVNPVRRNGTYDASVAGFEGRSVVDAKLNAQLIEELRERGLLLREELHEHSYPHCWRCGTRLLYYAKPSWYIATSTVRDRLLAANETVEWHPPHIKHGRFGDWLAGNVDWALSRERYWGTPLPIWRCSAAPEHLVCIGSFAELERRCGREVGDPHRPYVDELTFPCEECDGEMHRVAEVIDVWFDSGSMPFAQHHAPFENLDRYERSFPADFVCEALDQTRGWFYSLIAISTLLNDRAPYRNVVCLGLLVDEEGQKMSKSKGNVVVPWEVIDRFGADAFRWYFFTSKQPWDGYRFSVDAVGEGTRSFMRQLWNTYSFYVIYANTGDVRDGERSDLDHWVLSRLADTVAITRDRLDAYDATIAGRAIAAFVEDLSNWYVRRSRRRFWEGDSAAFATLRECLVTVAQLLAPFTPFIADEIYDNLDGELPSVHLCDFPQPGVRDLELEFAMATVRETVRLGLAARSQGDVKVRQPLREAIVVADGREREAIERLGELVRDELNVVALRFVDAADELGTYTIKPNFRALGPRFGKNMPQLAAAVAALDPATVAGSLRNGATVVVSVAGHDHELTAEDLTLALAPLEGYGLEREGSHAVALDFALDGQLIRGGQAREIVHAVQNARKNAGLQISDRIELWLGGDPELLAAAAEHEAHLAGETLATSITFDGAATPAGPLEHVKIDTRELSIGLRRA